MVSSDDPVDFDSASTDDVDRLFRGSCVSQNLTYDDDEWEAYRDGADRVWSWVPKPFPSDVSARILGLVLVSAVWVQIFSPFSIPPRSLLSRTIVRSATCRIGSVRL